MVQVDYRMDDDPEDFDQDPAAQIPRLEAEIERLARVTESCRKVILIAKVAMALAVLVLLATVTGLIRVDQIVPLAAVAAILGGITVAGSNARTLREASANIRVAEARRAELIGVLPFSAVIEDAKK
jgi:hypothetical protein